MVLVSLMELFHILTKHRFKLKQKSDLSDRFSILIRMPEVLLDQWTMRIRLCIYRELLLGEGSRVSKWSLFVTTILKGKYFVPSSRQFRYPFSIEKTDRLRLDIKPLWNTINFSLEWIIIGMKLFTYFLVELRIISVGLVHSNEMNGFTDQSMEFWLIQTVSLLITDLSVNQSQDICFLALPAVHYMDSFHCKSPSICTVTYLKLVFLHVSIETTQ